MARSIYLINPRQDFPSYFGTDVVEKATGRKTAYSVPLALPTVAAMIPQDFHITFCDDTVETIDFETQAEFIGLTGLVSQWGRMQEIAKEFRSRGKTVIIGGPHATLRHDEVHHHCDILVRGEIEEIAGDLFNDLRAGTWKDEYIGTSPSLDKSPIPRMDLYPNDRSLSGAIQITRGCPYNCEFCDVIQYLGRKVRHKTIPQVLKELDQLHDLGYGHVFITDDNITGHRKWAKKLLTAIRDWNTKENGKMAFFAQISVDAAEDDELLELCADAGIEKVFVGIETPNIESLKETGKRHNLKHDLVRQIERFVEHGIIVMGGMIVGFDSDGPDIFQLQYEFAQILPVPVFTPGPLYAPVTTPLYKRLQDEGRIVESSNEAFCTLVDTNIIPKQMSRDELTTGVKWLLNNLYNPRNYLNRILRTAELLDKGAKARGSQAEEKPMPLRSVEKECAAVLKKLPLLGFSETRMTAKLIWLAIKNRKMLPVVTYHLLIYMQLRHVLDGQGIWQPRLAKQESPWSINERRRRPQTGRGLLMKKILAK
jgi:radical SAM superfamily enzyme YgiQ (UPF0313 family)